MPRTLLARLGIHPGEPITRQAMIRALWDDSPPRTAANTLRSHLTRLRAQLTAAGFGGLVTTDGIWYALPDDIDSDIRIFEDTARSARDILTMGDPAAAITAIAGGLEMWRGDPLADCRPSEWSRAESARLTEIRTGMLETKFQAKILLGEHEALASELEQFVADFPFQERFWGLLITTLAASGRRAEALSAYQRARSILSEELGIEPGHDLQRLQTSILNGDFVGPDDMLPAIRTEESMPLAVNGPAPQPGQPGNIVPAPPTSFIGRQSELSTLAALLESFRLVTLTGVGGAGKSRLAIEAARRIPGMFPGGIWYLDLSLLDQPDLLLHQLLEILDIRDRTAPTLMGQLLGRLAGADALLILDNCEKMVDACADLVDNLLRSLPQLRILVTSRQALTLQGEHILAVAPLACPPDIEDNPAVDLFWDRAASTVSGLESPGLRDRELAVQICRRLEGIPLAIELAAVQLRVLSLDDLLQRLNDRFQALASGHRSAPKRHHTLRATIDWSFELCSPAEQILWARLSVFRGTFDLTAAEYVCRDDTLDSTDFTVLMANLVEKSVFARETHPVGVRFRMLESVSEYGREHLRRYGDDMRILDRHRDYYLQLVEAGQRAWFGPGQLDRLNRFRVELANLRAAFDHCTGNPGQTEAMQQLAAGLHLLWAGCDYAAEGQHWLNIALSAPEEQTPARAAALWVSARIDFLKGDGTQARTKLDEVRRLATRLGDERTLTHAMHVGGSGDLIGNEVDSGRTILKRAFDRYREYGGDPSMSTLCGIQLAMAHTLSGDPHTAIEYLRQALQLCAAADDEWIRSYGLYALSCATYELGNLDQALSLALDTLLIKHRFRDMVGLAAAFEQLARSLVDLGDHHDAARALGAARRCWDAMGTSWFGGSRDWQAIHDHAETACRRELPEPVYRAEFDQGFSMPLADLVPFVIVHPTGSFSRPDDSPPAPRSARLDPAGPA
ncbi:BTAD domain-containing putative transcriptional regulator [Nocardia sp. NPDC088792]|uniref:BTAD domain-containing putative transcriptional regulator n=1 Tax=Nocardia sp. NPDC088792 TaxID=3364332 RepID=UPI003825CB46